MNEYWMKCKSATIRRLVEIRTGRVLAEFYLPPETELTLRPHVIDRMLDLVGLSVEDVEWQDDPL